MPSANTEELRRKFTVVQQQRSAPPILPVPTSTTTAAAAGTSASTSLINTAPQTLYDPLNATTGIMMSTMTSNPNGAGGGGGDAMHRLAMQEPERTYVFPSGAIAGNMLGSTPSAGIPGVAIISGSHSAGANSVGRGHARSVSHGGGAILGPGGRPIKSAMKGHQRAFSQGQITDSPAASSAPTRGHSRVGSKTDFILPPGHKDETQNREFGPSVPSSATGRGHSRQASRSESIYTLRRSEAPPWWKRLGLCNTEKFEERSYRVVVPNHTVPPKTPKRDHPNGHFVANKIRTTKYTLLSFIPKNLLEQFHRVANLYFIFIVLLNWFPAINAFGKEVAMIPVVFVLGVTAVKDLFEDRRRRSSDKRINNTTCRVYDG